MLSVGMQNGATSVKKSMAMPQDLEIERPYDPAIPLLSIYPKELKSGSWRDVNTPMFIAVGYYYS